MSAYEGSEYNYRPSVKILGPPPQQFMIGDPSYNYWYILINLGNKMKRKHIVRASHNKGSQKVNTSINRGPQSK